MYTLKALSFKFAKFSKGHHLVVEAFQNKKRIKSYNIIRTLQIHKKRCFLRKILLKNHVKFENIKKPKVKKKRFQRLVYRKSNVHGTMEILYLHGVTKIFEKLPS